MVEFKGWEKISDDAYVADLGEVGSIRVFRSAMSGRWTARAFTWNRVDLETAIAAKATAVRMALGHLDTAAARIPLEDLKTALHRLDELKPSR
jgi:hypothetical protein